MSYWKEFKLLPVNTSVRYEFLTRSRDFLMFVSNICKVIMSPAGFTYLWPLLCTNVHKVVSVQSSEIGSLRDDTEYGYELLAI